MAPEDLRDPLHHIGRPDLCFLYVRLLGVQEGLWGEELSSGVLIGGLNCKARSDGLDLYDIGKPEAYPFCKEDLNLRCSSLLKGALRWESEEHLIILRDWLLLLPG